jgi:hypothetical protein
MIFQNILYLLHFRFKYFTFFFALHLSTFGYFISNFLDGVYCSKLYIRSNEFITILDPKQFSFIHFEQTISLAIELNMPKNYKIICTSLDFPALIVDESSFSLLNNYSASYAFSLVFDFAVFCEEGDDKKNTSCDCIKYNTKNGFDEKL